MKKKLKDATFGELKSIVCWKETEVKCPLMNICVIVEANTDQCLCDWINVEDDIEIQECNK